MAAVCMTASFLGGAATTSPAASQRRLVITNSAKPNTVKVSCVKEEGTSNGRREVVFAAITASLCSVAGTAVAEGPKRGTPEARKTYAPVCVANPTAKICNN